MTPHVRFTGMFWIVGCLVDGGHTESMDDILDHIRNRSLFEYLDQRYGQETDITLMPREDREKVIDFFQACDGINARRKFGIEHNGLMLLLAYAAEGVQQCVDSSHEVP